MIVKEAAMRVIYVRLLISGAVLATLLALGTFAPRDDAASPVAHAVP
ncbi:MAG TPA: hypothetical protein VJ696_04635 [Rhodanobacteraceae bacterium]|nr:hypothetical protein [Rhodanobacteraceae bacterium]